MMKFFDVEFKKIVVLSTILGSFSLLTMSCKQKNIESYEKINPVSEVVPKVAQGILPIAYVDVDSLLLRYYYAQDVNERLTKKMEDNRLTINQKSKKLETETEDFKRKYENDAFLTPDNAQQAYNRLQKQEQDLSLLIERMQNEWLMDQSKENMQIADSLRLAINLINADGRYQMIFNMRDMDNILFANPEYDITSEVLNLLNSRYIPTKKK